MQRPFISNHECHVLDHVNPYIPSLLKHRLPSFRKIGFDHYTGLGVYSSGGRLDENSVFIYRQCDEWLGSLNGSAMRGRSFHQRYCTCSAFQVPALQSPTYIFSTIMPSVSSTFQDCKAICLLAQYVRRWRCDARWVDFMLDYLSHLYSGTNINFRQLPPGLAGRCRVSGDMACHSLDFIMSSDQFHGSKNMRLPESLPILPLKFPDPGSGWCYICTYSIDKCTHPCSDQSRRRESNGRSVKIGA